MNENGIRLAFFLKTVSHRYGLKIDVFPFFIQWGNQSARSQRVSLP